MDEFSTCFSDADAVIVADVYAAGEAPIEGVDSDALVDGLRRYGHRRVLPLDESGGAGRRWSRDEAAAGDLVVLLGAGDITSWAYALPGRAGGAVGVSDWRDALPAVRGKLLRDEPLAPFTWFRVGGPADRPVHARRCTRTWPTSSRRSTRRVPRDRSGRRLQRHRARRRRRGRGDPAGGPGLRRDHDRRATPITAGAAALDAMVAQASAKAGSPGWSSTPASPAPSAAP